MIIAVYGDDGRLRFSVSGYTMPKGAILRECYETETEIVVCGTPDHNDESHDCDEMGCSSTSHVLYRFRKNEKKA